MKYISKIQRSTVLLVLLLVGWASHCPVSAQAFLEVVPDPSTNLVGSDNGTAVQPLDELNVSDYGIDTWQFKTSTDLVASGISEDAYYMYEKGRPHSKVNNRSGILAFWTQGADAGSTIRVSFAKIGNPPKFPVFSRTSCDFHEDFELTITDTNELVASIKYTTDGSEPGEGNGIVYSTPIVIPAGKDITVKAVSINENGVSPVTTATFHYVPKYMLNVNVSNKNAISNVYYSTDSEYGYWYPEGSISVVEGEDIYISYSLNTGYKCRGITLNGVLQDNTRNNFEFYMPASDVEMVIETEFDPSSPADPQPADTTTLYNLTLVSNPLGAGYFYGDGKYAAGTSVDISGYANSGYVFKGWTKDGDTISNKNSFRYTMPASDVVLMANYAYNPSSPGEPQQPALKHPLTVIASPAGAGTFSYTGSEVTYGEEYYVYAYPSTGYKFKGWIVNGVAQEETSSTLRGTMTEAGASVVGLFVFDPSSPSNPGANYYNSTTGQAIIDDFTPGSFYNAIRDVVGSDNYENVSSLIVKGRLESGDYGSLSYLRNAATIDLSRTGGTTTVPGYAFQNFAAANILLSSEVTEIGNYAFSGCENLTRLVLYAQVPPVCSAKTFSNFTNESNCALYVPSSAIELYATNDYWKDFTILPISTDAHVLQINLPAEASDGRYKHYSLEMVNLNSGVRQKYVVSDRLLYTFNGLRKDEQYNIYMYSQSGLEIGRIENVVIPDEDIEIEFNELKTLHTVNAKVLTADGSDVTSQVTVEWLKPLADGNITYLRKASSLAEVPEGQQLICRVSLDNNLGVVYMSPNDVEFTVGTGQNTCSVTLTPFRSVLLTGTVVDADGSPLSGASVSVSQTLNAKYVKTFTSKTDRKGTWSISVFDAPATRITYAASECVNVNDTIAEFDANSSAFDAGKVILKSIVGARVTYGFTYHAAGVEEFDTYYSDYQNVAVSVFNLTQNRAHDEISLQYPILAVLDENINIGDELRLTATSKTGAFNPIEQIVKVEENQRAEVTFDIVGKGGISASFEMTDNPSVIAMLYSAKGELLKKIAYSEAKALFTELEDGDYTLISMGHSSLMNSILRLGNYAEAGLTEDKDYVKNVVKVESGKLAEIKNLEIPAFDESLFYYTNSSTNFSANKSSITTGNYLTLRSTIDFKEVYKDGISNVALIVDLPEACDFVEQSVIQGPNLLPYVLDGNRLTVQLGNDYRSQVRLCAVPTTGGNFNATASIVFDYNGKTITQPIGTATSDIKHLEFKALSTVAKSEFNAQGYARAGSDVTIYDTENNILGNCRIDKTGFWITPCNLTNPYNLKTYNVYAVVRTPEGSTLQSETRQIKLDKNAIYPISVKCISDDITEGEVVFDFVDTQAKTLYYTIIASDGGNVTFIINMSNNSPERISNMILYVHQHDGHILKLYPQYDVVKDCWYANYEINMGNVPVNVSLDFDYVTENIVDRTYFDSLENQVNAARTEFALINDTITKIYSEINRIESEYANSAPLIREKIDKLANETNLHDDVQHLKEFYHLMQWHFDVSQVTVSPNMDNSQKFIDSLMYSVEQSLSDKIENITNLKEEFANTKYAADSVLKEIDDKTQLADTSIFNYNERSFVIETAIGNYDYLELPLSDLDMSSWDKESVTTIKMTDGSKLLYYYEDDNFVIVDEHSCKAWVLNKQLDTVSSQSRVSRITGQDVLENLRNAFVSLNTAKGVISEMISDWSKSVSDEISLLTSKRDELDMKLMKELAKSSETQRKIEKIERQLQEMGKQVRNGTSANYMGEAVDFNAKIEQLRSKRQLLLGQAEQYNEHISYYNSKINGFKAKLAVKYALYSEIASWWDIIKGIARLIDIVQSGLNDMSAWNTYINSILPCDAEESEAKIIKNDAERYRDKWGRGYVGASSLSIVSTGLSGYCSFNKAAKFVMRTIGSLVSSFIEETANSIFEETKNNSRLTLNEIKQRRGALKCVEGCGEPGMPPCPNPNEGNNTGGSSGNNYNSYGEQYGDYVSNTSDVQVHIDPAGFVYEAVPANRVEGVQATIYYKETKEDMYGDLYDEVVQWNAEEYAQKNPLFTDENGMYRWDVPKGLWQVKFEKDGYQTAYSEWLPVPPPQLEVNVGIVQNKQPEVVEARAYEEGVEVQFDKFMDLTTLTADNIFVTANGEKLNGEICFVDAALADEYASEDDADALRYASRVRFVPETSLGVTTGEIRVTVSRNVLSYAGIPMTETFSQVLDVEKEVQIIYADDVKVLYGGEKTVTVYAVPFDAAAGRTLRIANSSDLISSIDVDEAVLDEEGKAEIKVKGELPGSSQLTFSIDDVTATGTCAVDVVTEIITAEAPKASRASGTAVYRGTKLVLTTDSKDATIYFTTDGSCPCDENGTRRKYTVPIIIDDDTKILAMTAVGSGDEDVSETVEFNYTLKRSDMDIQMEEGWTWVSHNLEGAIPSSELASDEGVQRILSQTEELFRDPQLGMVGSLKELAASESYKIETTNATERKRFSDIARNPAAPINLSAGWNWLGYPVNQTMSVDEAFATTAAEALDVVVGQNGFAQYDGEKWIGTLETMSPGMGYMYQSQSAKKVVYNTSIVSNAAAKYATGISRNLPLVLDIHKYGKIMPVIATINDADGIVLDSEDYQVAAFCGSECRGIGRVVNGLVMMNVYGNANDNIVFHVYDAEGENSFSNNTSMVFVETVVGSVFKPFAIRINNATGISDVSYSGRIKVSVKGDMLRIKGIDADDIELVEVYGVNGQRLLRETNVSEYGIDISTLTGGVYVVIVNGNGEYTYHKIAIR